MLSTNVSGVPLLLTAVGGIDILPLSGRQSTSTMPADEEVKGSASLGVSPLQALSSASCTSRSAWQSRALVASSSINTRGFFSRALAMATLCMCVRVCVCVCVCVYEPHT